MKTIEIKGSERKEVGKKATRDLRRDEQIPCVVYGGEKNIHFSAPINDFRHLVYTPNVYIVKLDINGNKLNAIMKDITFHPVTDTILHIDFLELSDDKKIIMDIPVKLNGLAEGVKQGGKLILNSRNLKVKANLNDLPDSLDIDVTEIVLGKTIKVAQLNFENIELLNPKNSVVCSVKLTRSAMSAQDGGEEDGTEGGEGATEEAAE